METGPATSVVTSTTPTWMPEVTEAMPLGPTTPPAPSQTYEVSVISEGSRSPLPLVSRPTSTRMPPSTQLAPAGSGEVWTRPSVPVPLHA